MKNKNKKVKGLTIRTKLILAMGFLLIIPVLVLGTASYYVAKIELENSGKVLLKNSVEATIQVIADKQKLVEQGKITLTEAQESVREYMLGKKGADGKRPINANFNLGANGYLLAYTQEGVEAAHPSLEGKSVIDVTDKKTGSFLVKDQITVGNNGGGYLTYNWTLPNSEQIGQKITYQRTDPNWKWVVSAGTYMSDFNVGSDKILKITLIILLAVLVVGSAIILVFSKHIAKPIKQINEAVDLVASGNLNKQDISIKNRDEIGSLYESFSKMVHNMNSLIGSVKSSAGVVFTSSKELDTIVEENTSTINQVATSVEEIAKSTSEQAEETQKGAEKVRNLAERIGMVTELSIKTDATAESTVEVGNKGLHAIDILSEKSEKNRKSAEETSGIILDVDKTSVEIGAITEAISQISAQTNLLSLNAAIEAARAGEQGKGFAVVADEVRKLAAQSAESAAKVRELINNIQNKSQMAVKAMEESRVLAEEQNKSVIEAKEIFLEILNSIKKMNEDAKNIKGYSVEMENEKNEIVGILETLSASTEQNSAATQEVSAATEEQLASVEQIGTHTQDLKSLAEKLREAVDAFQV